MLKIHLIAIGGAAMHNLALELAHQGHRVSGSDDQIFEPSKSRLERAGLLPTNGWNADKISADLDVVVLGMHAHADNPELKRALELGLKVQSYPEFIYERNKSRTRIVVAGSHGKTSITSMILHVLNELKQEVNYLVGAQLPGFDRMVKLDESLEFMVIEGDEYLSSTLDRRSKFLWYKPNIAIISGIEWDHANVFPDRNEYYLQFEKFVESIMPGGSLAYFEEDERLKEIVLRCSKEIRLFPYATPQYRIEQSEVILETHEGEVALRVFGRHNLQNLEAARLICNQLGVMDSDFYSAISSFEGASRRLEKIYEEGGKCIYRDFAHAPSKVKATISAVREFHPSNNFIACFELHTFSSLSKSFLPQYQDSMNLADHALIYFNPAEVERKRLPALEMAELKQYFNRTDLQIFIEKQALLDGLKALFSDDSILLLMSSGQFGGMNLEELKGK